MSERITPDAAANFIMPDAPERKRLAMLPLLDVRPPRSPNSSRETIEEIPQPQETNPGVKFNYSYDELVEIAHEFTPGNPEDLERVLRYGLVWSGMKIDDELTHWATTDHGYQPYTRLSRVTLPVHNKRLSVRAVPNSWEGDYDTPFTLHKGETGAQILATDHNGSQIEIATPRQRYVTESVLTLAYVKEQHDGTKDLTINPLQRCPQKCEFCCRGYHDMTLERKKELINLSPDEMARYLKVKFPKLNWNEVSEITLVTGDFHSDTDILEYMQGFVESMSHHTSGQWNPLANPHQDIAVSTHLLDSRDSMEQARALGMKRFMYTAEMSDDERREQVMYVSKAAKNNEVNKGHTSFSGVLGVLQTAIDVFGEDAVEPVLVVGLDSLDKTKQSMDRLRELRIKRVSRAMLNVYNMNQFSLMSTSFEDTVKGMQYARDLFESPYSRVVKGDNLAANSKELFS